MSPLTEQPEDTRAALSRCIATKTCVVFVGSGPSSPIFCTWDRLINTLCENCGVPERVSPTSSPDDLLDAAESARKANIELYHRTLGDEFGRADLTSPVFGLLMRMPFASYVTVNFDPLLEQEASNPEHRCPHVECYPSLSAKYLSRRTVYYHCCPR